MVARDLTNQRRVTPSGQAAQRINVAGVALGVAEKIITTNNEAKINEGVSAVQLELNELSQRMRLENQTDPQAGKAKFEQERKAIFDKHGANIAPMFRNAWTAQTQRIKVQSDVSNADWAFKQTQVNTKGSIQNSMENGLSLAVQNGREFARGETTELESFANFDSSATDLQNFGNQHLGENVTAELMADYEDDYAKSFISGVIEANPDKAEEIMAGERFKDKFTPEENKQLRNNINVRRKEIRLAQLGETTKNEDAMLEALENPSGDYFSKRVEVDKAEIEGRISTKFATQARRLLSSEKAVDALTSNDDMADVITQIYDLNATAEQDSESYLVGIQNINEKITSLRASGKLNREDGIKLQNQIRTLTGNKLAKATDQVSINFLQASEQINQLPPELRGGAIREMFYRTLDKDNLGKQDYNNVVNGIIDEVNDKRRDDTLNSVSDLLDPSKTESLDRQTVLDLGFTDADIEKTLKDNNITLRELVIRLEGE